MVARLAEERGVKLSAQQVANRNRLADGEAGSQLNHHQLATIYRFRPKGREEFLAHVERAARNGNETAQAFWDIWSDLMPANRARVDLDLVCEGAGITPDQLAAVVISTAMRSGQDAADYYSSVMQAEIVAQTAKSAMRITGEHTDIAQKDRQWMLEHYKFIQPARGGTLVSVQANSGAIANSQPSVPTFQESLAGVIDVEPE